MPGPRILLVDDDRALVDVLSMALDDAGFSVETAADGAAGWSAFVASPPDVVILDLMMPQLDGLEVCRRIRRTHEIPVVMLTSKNEELDRVLGLELGADDYVTKPFSTRELVARLKAVLRRTRTVPTSSETHDHLCEVDALQIDRTRWEVRYRGQRVSVTATELDLLWTLAKTPGRAFSRDALIDAVYGPGMVVAHRTIDTFVKRLRKKLSAIDPDFDRLETVRSVGYRYRA